MIEARQITYDWASAPNSSVSQKKFNGDVQQTNYIKNPLANGSTPAIAGSTIATDSAMGGSAFRAAATGTGTQTFTTVDAGPAVAGQRWYARALMRFAAAGPGGRRMQLACRFRDSGGALLAQPTVTKELPIAGTFRRWTGTANASTSEEYTGQSRRVNLAPDPRATGSLNGQWSGRWFGGGSSAGTQTYVSGPDGPDVFSTYTRKTWTAVSANSGDTGVNTTGTPVSVVAGQQFSLSGWLRPNAAGAKVGGARAYFVDASGNNVTGPNDYPVQSLVLNQWNKVSVTSTVPAGATGVYPILDISGTSAPWAVGESLDATGALVETDAPVGKYFDGSTVTPLSGKYRNWTGTASASPSVEVASDGSQRINLASIPRGSAWASPPQIGFQSGRYGGDMNFSLVTSVTGPSGTGITTAARGTWTTTSAPGRGFHITGNTDAPSPTPLTAKQGDVLSLSHWVRPSNNTQAISIKAIWVNQAGAFLSSLGISSESTVGRAGQWTRLSVVSGAAPAGASTVVAMVTVDSGSAVVGDTLDVTGLLIERVGSVGTFFDGGTTDTAPVLPTGLADAAVYDMNLSAVAPANTAFADFFLVRANVIPMAGDVLWSDALVLTQSDSTDTDGYFDGDFPGATEYINVDRPGDITTDEWIEIDGVPLNTYAYNVTTWGGNRLSPPGVRGSNITVPGRPGSVFMNKELDVQEVTLNMWVQGTETDGLRPTDGSPDHKFDDNWKRLRKLLFQVRREMTMTKRWYDYDAKAIRSASGKVQYNGGLEPTMTGRSRALFSVNFLMNDPFFYETTRELPVSTTQQKTWQEEVDGDWRTTSIVATIVGPRVNPKITVTHDDGTVTWVQYNGTLASGESVSIDVNAFSAYLTSGGTTRPVTGRITHDGATPWLTLEPGDNTIVLTSNSGAGAVSIAYDPVWF